MIDRHLSLEVHVVAVGDRVHGKAERDRDLLDLQVPVRFEVVLTTRLKLVERERHLRVLVAVEVSGAAQVGVSPADTAVDARGVNHQLTTGGPRGVNRHLTAEALERTCHRQQAE